MNSIEFLTEYLTRASLLIALTCGALWLGSMIRIPAALRHRIGMIGTAFVLLMPILLLAGWQWAIIPSPNLTPINIENASAIITHIDTTLIQNTSLEKGAIAPLPVNPSAQSSLSLNQANTPGLFITLWLVGVLGFVLYAAPGFSVLRRLKRDSSAIDPQLKLILDELLLTQKSKTRVEIVISPQVQSPFTWGIFRHVIALPTEAINWPAEKTRLVFLHELAHISRRDAASLLLNRLLIALHWFNPLAWLLSRKLENLREEVCDGHVLRKGASPTDYAECLVQMASDSRSNRNFSLAVSESKTIETRINMILNHSSTLTSKPRQLLNWSAASFIAILACFITTLAFAEAAKNDANEDLQTKKLKEIMIPKVDLSSTSMKDSVNFLVHLSREKDTISTKKSEKGVNMVLLGDFKDVNITLKLSNIPLEQALLYVAALGNAELEIKKHVVVIRKTEKKTTGSQYPRYSNDVAFTDKTKSPIGKKLDHLFLPSVQFSDTPLDQAIAYIRDRSVELDVNSPADSKGINFILEAPDSMPKVSLNLRNIPIGDLMSLTAEAAGYHLQIDEHAVMIRSGVKE